MRHVALVALLAAAHVPASAAQEPDFDPLRGYATREWLRELLQQFELSAESPVYSPYLRQRAAREAARIRARLDRGDFQTGDQIYLNVTNEEALSDTFTVEPGPVLRLPTVGPVSLAGVLRAELTDHLRQQIARLIRDPDLRVETLIRVAVLGTVGQPGFYQFPSNLVFTDALMRAGLAGGVQLDNVRIDRGERRLWGGDELTAAIDEGRTLDQLNLRPGDRIVVSGGAAGGLGAMEGGLRALVILLALPGTILGLTRVF